MPFPIASATTPTTNADVMPSAQALIVLNVAGATAITSAGGHTSGSPGILYSLRTGCPVSAARPSMDSASQRAAVGVNPRHTSHPSPWADSITAATSNTGGAAEPNRYRVRDMIPTQPRPPAGMQPPPNHGGPGGGAGTVLMSRQNGDDQYAHTRRRPHRRPHPRPPQTRQTHPTPTRRPHPLLLQPPQPGGMRRPASQRRLHRRGRPRPPDRRHDPDGTALRDRTPERPPRRVGTPHPRGPRPVRPRPRPRPHHPAGRAARRGGRRPVPNRARHPPPQRRHRPARPHRRTHHRRVRSEEHT